MATKLSPYASTHISEQSLGDAAQPTRSSRPLRHHPFPAPWFVVRAFERLFYWDAATAALTVLRPLVDPTIEPGSYLVPVARPHVSSDRAADAELGVRLWSASEVLVADIRHANGNYSDVMY